MSATYQERVDNWAAWITRNAAPEGWRLAGFIHWCGPSANVVHNWHEYDGECCEGCRHQIDGRGNHDAECEPFYVDA